MAVVVLEGVRGAQDPSILSQLYLKRKQQDLDQYNEMVKAASLAMQNENTRSWGLALAERANALARNIYGMDPTGAINFGSKYHSPTALAHKQLQEYIDTLEGGGKLNDAAHMWVNLMSGTNFNPTEAAAQYNRLQPLYSQMRQYELDLLQHQFPMKEFAKNVASGTSEARELLLPGAIQTWLNTGKQLSGYNESTQDLYSQMIGNNAMNVPRLWK